jgi:hypothetical protein
MEDTTMSMKYFYIIAFILLVLCESCKEQITSPLTQSSLQLNFVQGSIGADRMPIAILPGTIPIPSDPFGCRLALVAKNTSQTNTLSNIQIGSNKQTTFKFDSIGVLCVY